MQFDMERTFKLQDRQNYPETCLYLLLQTKQNLHNGLRQPEEVKKILDHNFNISMENPAEKYRVLGELGEGGQAEVFKTKRLTDNQFFALKMLRPKSRKDKEKLMNEFKIYR